MKKRRMKKATNRRMFCWKVEKGRRNDAMVVRFTETRRRDAWILQ